MYVTKRTELKNSINKVLQDALIMDVSLYDDPLQGLVMQVAQVREKLGKGVHIIDKNEARVKQALSASENHLEWQMLEHEDLPIQGMQLQGMPYCGAIMDGDTNATAEMLVQDTHIIDKKEALSDSGTQGNHMEWRMPQHEDFLMQDMQLQDMPYCGAIMDENIEEIMASAGTDATLGTQLQPVQAHAAHDIQVAHDMQDAHAHTNAAPEMLIQDAHISDEEEARMKQALNDSAIQGNRLEWPMLQQEDLLIQDMQLQDMPYYGAPMSENTQATHEVEMQDGWQWNYNKIEAMDLLMCTWRYEMIIDNWSREGKHEVALEVDRLVKKFHAATLKERAVKHLEESGRKDEVELRQRKITYWFKNDP
ncbi:unnamed protein product [Blepharisma stoltei]|uniref:Uncharacterized protein n=1 Tax=Blepharisma stoltei TaxID=1481888 RepID=A0AAU9JBN8_9CILI|nr:unnamed protein product [Blepharisma stoltei]